MKGKCNTICLHLINWLGTGRKTSKKKSTAPALQKESKLSKEEDY